MADYSQYSSSGREWTQYVQAGHLRPPASDLSLHEKRILLNKSRAELHREVYSPKTDDNVVVSDLLILGRRGTVEARLYRPEDSDSGKEINLPIIIHLHSGGWHLGNLETEDPFCAYLCSSLYRRKRPGAVVLSINYRHTPEYRYPTQLDDAYAALEFLTEPKSGISGVDTTKIILTGISAGAHLATGCMIRDVQRKGEALGRNVIGLILTCPPTVYPDLFPYHLLRSREISSYVENANDPLLGVERARMFWDLYLLAPEADDLSLVKPLAVISPLTAEDHLFDAGWWPQTSFHVAGLDCLRDEALLFEDKLRRQGVKTRLHMYPGFPHAFPMLPQLQESKSWMEKVLDDLCSMIDEGN